MDRTIITTIVALIVAINETLMVFGITTFENVTAEQIYTIVSTIAMVLAWAMSHWFNNDFTVEAKASTKLMKQMKELSKVTPKTVNEPDEEV